MIVCIKMICVYNYLIFDMFFVGEGGGVYFCLFLLILGFFF